MDWARARIWEGDTVVPLGTAYAIVWQAVTSVREEQNRRFGELLANWTKTGSHDRSVIRVEHLIERVIAPLAKRHPVLLVVIDGMGMAVFRELQTDLIGRGWVEIDSADDSQRLPVIAALPTVTEVSRTSLLCGALAAGNASDEKAGFCKHPALVAAGSRSKSPVLYHKADLAGDGTAGLASTVVGAITDDKRRIVGVVINAVDDHLAKGDQIRVDWTVHRIKPLDELLAAASDAGRAVVVSDHGHIPEHKTQGRGEESAERWREAVGMPKDDEVLLAAPRVVLGNGQKITAPWSERVRYSAKKNGYHGGASPQEVVIPLGIFAPSGVAIDGCVEVTSETPDWWQPEIEQTVRTVKSARVAKPHSPSRPGEQGRLFPTEEEIAGTERPSEPEWIDGLMTSALMVAQRQLASRVALPEERIRAILAALDERGGKLTRTALAKRIGIPPMRVGGMISALRRLLNVEGYPVLSVDEQSDTVALNRRQLFTQFGLSAHRDPVVSEQRLGAINRYAPSFSTALRAYRRALTGADAATADGILAWLSGEPNVGAGPKRYAGIKGNVDHFGALSFLQGLLVILRDAGFSGLVLVLDEVETLQRVRGDVREKSLNALRQLIDEVDAGRFPGPYLLITGTPAFFEGPQGVQRLPPLAQRLQVDFSTEARFDNPRAVQIRLPAFDLTRLGLVGRTIRDIYAAGRPDEARLAALANDAYIDDLARAVAGDLGGRVGVAPRIFLKKLVGDVLDRIDQFDDFDPRQHYSLTIDEAELTEVERNARGATHVDDIDLKL